MFPYGRGTPVLLSSLGLSDRALLAPAAPPPDARVKFIDCKDGRVEVLSHSLSLSLSPPIQSLSFTLSHTFSLTLFNTGTRLCSHTPLALSISREPGGAY